jgi:anti-sigma B factor antagonist
MAATFLRGSEGFGLELRMVDGCLTMVLAGSLDASSAPQLRAAIEGLGDGDLMLDLSELTFLDSSGLGCLFRLQQRVADGGGLLAARGACTSVRRTIQMVQLNRVMALLD